MSAPVKSPRQTSWEIAPGSFVVARGSSWEGWSVIAIFPDRTFTFGAYDYRADAEVVATTVAILMAAEVSL